MGLFGIVVFPLIKGAVCNTVIWQLEVEMGTAVLIQNIGECHLSLPLIHRLNDYAGWQTEDTQKEWTQLTTEGDEPYNVSW